MKFRTQSSFCCLKLFLMCESETSVSPQASAPPAAAQEGSSLGPSPESGVSLLSAPGAPFRGVH